MSEYFDYWGKAGVAAEARGFHRLVYHGLDVAAVGAALLDRVPAHLERLSALSGFLPECLRSALPFQLSLHDLGKFSEPFQDQRPELVALLQGPRPARACDIRHDSLGYLLWKEWGSRRVHEREADLLAELHPIAAAGVRLRRQDLSSLMQPWMAAVLGHHGRPPEERPLPYEVFRAEFDGLCSRSRADAGAFLRDARALLAPAMLVTAEADLDALEPKLRRASWWVAGFTILCDWLGSNDEYFPFESGEVPLRDYWARALDRAREAVQKSGLVSSAPKPFRGIGELLPRTIAESPSPLQAAAAAVELAEGPQLFVLEDLTGSGKTEAALVLAHRLMASGHGGGLFFALPTMATANAMAPRVASLVEKLFAGGASFLLTHSGPRLAEQDRLRIAGEVVEASPEPDQPGGSAAAAAWLADGRKKALLAELGVGTIDQVLLAVLQSKHAAVRLFGLQHRVLVVDEVHACDAYMFGVLSALLKAHAALGGSAILLSATLPLEQRRRLAQAFAEGLGLKGASLPASASYPLLTGISAAGVVEHAVSPRHGTPRSLPVRWHESSAAVVDRLMQASADGLSACWVRNSVADALEAYQALSAVLPKDKLTLFHARFALGDRLGIEQCVVDRFGPGGGGGRRGHIVVATQVVEQSLDVDFDVMVSDVCPIDLVIQRAGRLQRHGDRHPGRPAPVLELFAPAWSDEPPPGWLAGPFRRTSIVYDDPAVLWRTMDALRATGSLSTPEHARSLVEAVYAEDDSRPLPESLAARSGAAQGKKLAQGSMAGPAALKLRLGYLREGADWSSEARTPTRLGEPTTTIRLAKLRADGSPAPWFDRVPRLRWPLSQVSVARRLVAKAAPGDEGLRALLEADQPFVADDVVTVVLREGPERTWAGSALAERTAGGVTREVPVRLVYSVERGLGVEYLEGK